VCIKLAAPNAEVQFGKLYDNDIRSTGEKKGRGRLTEVTDHPLPKRENIILQRISHLRLH